MKYQIETKHASQSGVMRRTTLTAHAASAVGVLHPALNRLAQEKQEDYTAIVSYMISASVMSPTIVIRLPKQA
eukprot:scaffold538917_cov27-Prasinocladus_malaysianus.AAC.1